MKHAAMVCILVLLWMTGCASQPRRVVSPPPAISTTAAIPAPAGQFQPDANLYLCPSATITNALEADSRNRLLNFNPVVLSTARSR